MEANNRRKKLEMTLRKKIIATIIISLILVPVLAGCSDTDAVDRPDPRSAKIGGLNGSMDSAICKENYPDANYKYYSSLGDCTLALQSGAVDYVSIAHIDACNYMRADSGYVICEKLSGEMNCSAAFPKNSKYLDAYNEVLAKYKEDGTLDHVYDNWIRSDNSPYVEEEIPQRGADAPVLRVATGNCFEPTSFLKDGELVGYDVELAKRIGYDMGMRVEFVAMDFEAILSALQSDKADVAMCMMGDTPERREAVDFSDPYFTDYICLLGYDKTASASAGKFESLQQSFEKTFLREGRWKQILSGIGVTLIITIGAAILGLILSAGICAMRMSRKTLLSGLAKIYIRIIQGTPMVVFLMICYYLIFHGTGLNGVAVSIIAFAINFSAYASEIMRNSIGTVDNGQLEAAYALGFSKSKTFKTIVAPQAVQHMLPLMKGEFVSLLKATSIVGYIAVEDLTRVGDIIRSLTYEAFFPLIVTAVIYFLLSWLLASAIGLIEFKTNPLKRKHITSDDYTGEEQL